MKIRNLSSKATKVISVRREKKVCLLLLCIKIETLAYLFSYYPPSFDFQDFQLVLNWLILITLPYSYIVIINILQPH